MAYLFSYGTLRNVAIQKDLFKRELIGWPDTLLGYALSQEKVYGQYPTISKVSNASEQLSGMVYEITTQELNKADAYEGNAYSRILIKLKSRKEAWVYIAESS